ncbi:MAG: IS21 family transposase [bacterium]|nr:IS21 family transposase [bacterium]
MIDIRTIAYIRQRHYGEHWPVGTIAAELGLHHQTVARALRQEGPRAAPPPRPSQLDAYLGFIRETLEQYPRLRSTRLWQMLRARGCPLSVRQVRRKVAELRPASREAFLRRRTFPAEEGQVDWASFGHVMIGAARRALSAFILTLTYSRMLFVRFFFDQSMANFLRGHVEAFAHLGGVPRYLLYDNLRSAVSERHGDGVRFNPRLLELASHYHFAPRACRPRRGNEKGAVERTVRYVRESFFAARPFTTLEDFNRQALAWRDEVTTQRPWPGDDRKKVAEVFAEEAPRLLPLPVHPFETDLVLAVRSGKTLYLRFDLNDYSIPPSSVLRPLTLLASETSVRILDGTQEVAQHRRSYDRHRRIEDPAHIAALLAEKRRARGSSPCARLIDATPAAEAFLEASFQRGESVAATTEKLLLLLDDYGADELRAAVAEALQRQTPRISSVAYILAKQRRASRRKPVLPVDLTRRPDLKDLYVKPHASETYDELSRHDDDERD